MENSFMIRENISLFHSFKNTQQVITQKDSKTCSNKKSIFINQSFYYYRLIKISIRRLIRRMFIYKEEKLKKIKI